LEFVGTNKENPGQCPGVFLMRGYKKYGWSGKDQPDRLQDAFGHCHRDVGTDKVPQAERTFKTVTQTIGILDGCFGTFRRDPALVNHVVQFTANDCRDAVDDDSYDKAFIRSVGEFRTYTSCDLKKRTPGQCMRPWCRHQ